jgi:hypothetical protein
MAQVYCPMSILAINIWCAIGKGRFSICCKQEDHKHLALYYARKNAEK